MTRRIERVSIAGEAGALDGVLLVPERPRSGAALLCHPDPQRGGTMHSKTLARAARALAGFGLPVLRFDFRGVGRSAGSHSGGPGERRDALAALEWLAARHPGEPLLAGGFSFGSWVGMQAGAEHGAVTALVGIAPPLALYDFAFLERGAHAILCIAGDSDPFCPVAALEASRARIGPRLQVTILPGAAHLLTTHLAALEEEVRHFAATRFAAR